MQSTPSVPAVERALVMMETLDRSVRGMNIAELARRLGIARSSAHSIILTLERCGYLTRDATQRHCMLTSKAYLLGRETMSCERLATVAHTPMRKLSATTQLTSHMAMLEENQATYIQKVPAPGPRGLDTYVGKRTNLHCTAVGKVLLSYAPETYRSRILDRGAYARYTPHTITAAPVLRQELERVSVMGYATDDQEEELNIRCIAVPVFSRRGEMLAALSVSGTTAQLHENRTAETVALLQKAAAQVGSRFSEMEIQHV